MNSLSIYKGLPRSAYILALSRVVSGSGNFIFPFMTLLLTQKVGLSATNTGLVIFIASIAYVPGSLIGGKLADKYGRKPVLVLSELCVAICWICCGFFPHSTLIIPFIATAYFFLGALEPILGAVGADISNADNRKAIYSLSYLGWNIGFAIGPFIGGLLFLNYAHWMFWGDGLTVLGAVVLVWLYIPESKPGKSDKAESIHEEAEEGSVWPVILARPHLILFTVAAFFATLVYAQVGFSLPLQLNELYGDMGSQYFGTIMGFTGLIVVILTAPIIGFTKNLHSLTSIGIGVALYILGFGFLGELSWLPFIFFAAFIFTVGEILDVTNRGVYIANHSPMSHRARINSILPVIIGSAMTITPLVTGIFIDHFGVRAVWPVSALIGSFSLALYILLGRLESRWLKLESIN